ncbi:MAG: ECF-type sigma factor [Blastocatellia bacterium]
MVALRYIFGFSLEETCQALGLSLSTVTRQWRAARAFLKREMTKASDGSAGADPNSSENTFMAPGDALKE